MIKNSIEEDIKIINNFIAYLKKNNQTGDMAVLTVLGEEIEALEHILQDYKRVLKENEEYSKQLDLDYVDKNYISKKKIEDTIEELKGKLEDISKRREKSKTKEEETVLWCLEIRTDERIKTLQELL